MAPGYCYVTGHVTELIKQIFNYTYAMAKDKDDTDAGLEDLWKGKHDLR